MNTDRESSHCFFICVDLRSSVVDPPTNLADGGAGPLQSAPAFGRTMGDRNVHYEAAFEAYLRQRAIPYVAVDEAKRALFANAKLKGFDFVVYSKNGPNLLIDIKGRQCNNAKNGGGGRRSLQTWATGEDGQ